MTPEPDLSADPAAARRSPRRLFRDLAHLLSDERPLLGWWLVLIVLSVLFAVFELVGSIAILVLMRLFLDGDVPALEIGAFSIGLPSGVPLETLKTSLAVAFLGLFVVRAALMVVISYLGARLSTMASVRISRRLLRGYLYLPYVEHTQRRTSEMIRDTFVSTERLHAEVTRPLTMLITDVIIALGLISALLIVDVRATLIAAGFLIAATLAVQGLVRPRLRDWGRLAQEATTGSLEVLQQALSGIRDIRLLGQEQSFLDHHSDERRRLARYRYLSLGGQSIPRSTIELATISVIVLLLLTFGRADAGTQSVLPVLGAFAYVGLRLQPIINRFIKHANEIRSNQVLIEQLLSERDRLADVPAALPAETVAPRPDTSAAGAIVLSGVSFAYPGWRGDRPRPVLTDVSLHIPVGSFVGISGPTGGGKSTLLDVLVGLIRPSEGTVTVGGVELGPAPRWWWERLGVVSQAVYTVPGTIRENVAFGRRDTRAPEVEARIRECLDLAQMTETVEQLPAGLDTPVGDAGVRLSGGQRQRLSLARAVFRDPEVLVLDEGTSALDEVTEAAVMAALRGRSAPDRAPRTLIVVTHRLASIRGTDLHLVVEGGRLRTR